MEAVRSPEKTYSVFFVITKLNQSFQIFWDFFEFDTLYKGETFYS